MIYRIFKFAFLGFIYKSGLWLLFRFLNRRRLAILMYHGLTIDELLIWTQTTLANFERQVEYVYRHYHTIGLAEALQVLKREKPCPLHPLVITFDDGFMSNKTLAYPLLKKYKLPASIFLTTSFVDKSPRFDGLIRTDYIVGLFRRSPKSGLDLKDQGLGVMKFTDLKSRIEAAYRVSNALKRMSRTEEYRLIGILEDRLGNGLCARDQYLFRSLDWDQVRQMQREGLVTFGAHTENHEILSRLSYDEAVSEMVGSKEKIEKVLGVPVRHLAYPNGTPADFNPQIAEIASRHFDCALTTVGGLASPGDDLFSLKRIGVGNDMTMWRFKLELAGVFDFINGVKSLVRSPFRRQARPLEPVADKLLVGEDDHY